MGSIRGRPGQETKSEFSSFIWKPNGIQLTEAPTMVERIHELIAKKDTEDPNRPACNVGDGAQDPVTTRTRYSRGFGIRKLGHSANRNGVKKQILAKAEQVELNSLNYDVHSVEIEKGLEGHLCVRI